MSEHKTAILAGGCFWGMEDHPQTTRRHLDTGGRNANATYRNHPGHAEAVEIVYDPALTDYRSVLEFFFQIHDPLRCRTRKAKAEPSQWLEGWIRLSWRQAPARPATELQSPQYRRRWSARDCNEPLGGLPESLVGNRSRPVRRRRGGCPVGGADRRGRRRTRGRRRLVRRRPGGCPAGVDRRDRRH